MRRMHTRLRGFGTTSPAMAAAYSTRKIGPSYSGPALRVRRSSDNVEADIGFLADGTLNETALLAHVGANSGFVSKLYDQSGNGRDLAQATAASQPRIVNAGVIDRLNTRAAVRTDGVSQTMVSPAFALNQPLTRSTVLQFLSTAANQVFTASSANGFELLFSTSVGTLGMDAGATLNIKSGFAANDSAVVTEVFSGAGSLGSYNGASVTGNTGTNGVLLVAVGARGNGNNPANALFGDIILYPAALSTTDRQLLEANQKLFWGTP